MIITHNDHDTQARELRADLDRITATDTANSGKICIICGIHVAHTNCTPRRAS